LEQKAKNRTTGAIGKLLALRPKTAIIEKNGEEKSAIIYKTFKIKGNPQKIDNANKKYIMKLYNKKNKLIKTEKEEVHWYW
jgi:hypothetical protein